MRKFESVMESVLFRSRWLLAPFFFGLIVAIIALLVKFGKELLSLVTGLLGMNGSRPESISYSIAPTLYTSDFTP